MHPRSSALALSLALLSLAALPGSASADGWYTALDVGRTTVPGLQLGNSGGSFHPSPTVSGFSNPVGYRLGLGYRFTPYFALEGAYADFGAASKTFRGEGCVVDANGLTSCGLDDHQHDSVKTSGLIGDAVGTWPVSEHFSLFAEGGIILAHSDVNISDNLFANLSSSFESTANSIRPTFGFGADWSVGQDWKLRLSLNRYKGVRLSKTFNQTNVNPDRSYNVDLLALGIVYSF